VADVILIIAGVLLSATAFAAIEYYRQIRRARQEYERARGTIEDIVVSFNRQLKREAEKFETVAYKVEALRGRKDGSLIKAEDALKRISAIESKLTTDSQEVEQVFQRLDDAEKKARDLMTSHETLEGRIGKLEEQSRAVLPSMEPIFQPVISIKREKAIGQLTETEISVLEFLTSEGPKTAPEIKERVRLSREHTARLMKKLYEDGYLERETNKIPFKYSVKKEMEKLLKKPGNQAA
jgi:DNA repair exonuclease SbcCD ATPase subunit